MFCPLLDDIKTSEDVSKNLLHSNVWDACILELALFRFGDSFDIKRTTIITIVDVNGLYLLVRTYMTFLCNHYVHSN